MAKITRTKLINQVKKLICQANLGDEIVCCEDGKETTNTYPIAILYEPDAKTPTEWIKAICFCNEYSGRNCEISFKLKKG